MTPEAEKKFDEKAGAALLWMVLVALVLLAGCMAAVASWQ